MKIFSRQKNSSKNKEGQKSRLWSSPEREWGIILAVFICLNIAALGFHAFLFYQISRGGFFTPPERAPVTTNSVDRDRLREVLNVFEEKEAQLIKKITTTEDIPRVR